MRIHQLRRIFLAGIWSPQKFHPADWRIEQIVTREQIVSGRFWLPPVATNPPPCPRRFCPLFTLISFVRCTDREKLMMKGGY